MAKNFYTLEDDEVIRQFYSSWGPGLLVEKLNRSYGSIRYRALKLQVKQAPLSYLTIFRVARFLGVVPGTVRVWMSRGFLKASKSGRRQGFHQEWRIEPQDFYDFVGNHYYLYDPERVKDKFLRAIIETTPAAKVLPVCQAVRVLGIASSTVIKRVTTGKFPVAYKGFGPAGHIRWYVQLDDAAFEWFRDLADNHYDQAAGWLVETVRLPNPDAILLLDALLKYERARVKMIRERIRHAPVADRIVREFEATPAGERLRTLTS